MKQKLKPLFTAVLLSAVICSCSKHTGKQIAADNAPSINRGLNLNKGQKLQVENTVKSVSTMEMMGQSMEINADVAMTRLLEVKDKKDSSYNLTSTITRMNISSSIMGQAMSYDSDKKEDSASEMGKLMKGQINASKEMELDNEGKVIKVKNDSKKTEADGDNPMAAMMQTLGAEQDESNGANDVFQVLLPGVKTNDSWSDSVITEGSKTYRTYTVKSIEGNDATLILTGSQSVNKTLENQGMEATVSLDSKISGEVLVDKTTGVVKQKTMTIEGTGSTEAMGQAIPMTTKVTSTWVIKSL